MSSFPDEENLNNFELAIAVAVTMFGVNSGGVLLKVGKEKEYFIAVLLAVFICVLFALSYLMDRSL